MRLESYTGTKSTSSVVLSVSNELGLEVQFQVFNPFTN